MNRLETVKMFALFKAAYPRFYISITKEEANMQISIWAELLADVPYQIVEIAAKKLLLESVYPPTIADIRKQITEVTTTQIDATTAWGEVMNAIRQFGYYRPNEAMSSLSPTTAKVVKCIGWNEINTSEEMGVIRGQFLKMYETANKRDIQEKNLPQELKNIIRSIGINAKELGAGNA